MGRQVKGRIAPWGAILAALLPMSAAVKAQPLAGLAGPGADQLMLENYATVAGAGGFKDAAAKAPQSSAAPPTIMRLDYLGRELLLDGMEKDFAAAAAHLKTTEETWKALKARVAKAGGLASSKAYERELASLKSALRARDAAALISAAKASLDAASDIQKWEARRPWRFRPGP